MAHGVFHKELGEINLSELDIHDPEDRKLWDSLYGKTRKGDLECLDCRRNDPECPQWMFLRLWKGRPVAVHYSRDVRHSTAPESPRHLALKERIARTAEKAGYSAELEARAPDGRRRPTSWSTVTTASSCAARSSSPTPPPLRGQAQRHRTLGRPEPAVDHRRRQRTLIDRAPWARIDHMPVAILRNGNALLIRGGVKDLKLVRCDSRNPVPCPDRSYGRCNHWHGTWAPVLGMHLDQLIGATAAGEYLPLYLPAQRGRRGRAAHLWVTADDREKYLDATGETPTEPLPGMVDDNEPAQPEHLPLSRECSYEQHLEEKKRRGSTPRDTGESLPTGITIPAQEPPTLPEPRPTTFLSRIAAQHRAVSRPIHPQQRGPAQTPASPPGTPPWQAPKAPELAPRPRPPEPDLVPTSRKQSLPPSPRPDRRALAARLGCAPDQVGPCARCHELTHRYGNGGSPLCRTCR